MLFSQPSHSPGHPPREERWCISQKRLHHKDFSFQRVRNTGGVIAHGTADGHQWRLAVQDIADPGYTCLAAITINGTDADPVYPDPGTGAAVALGSSLPGIGFGSRPVAPRHQRDRRQRRRQRARGHRGRLRVPVPRRRLRVLAGQTAAGDRGESAARLAAGLYHATGQHPAAQHAHHPGDGGLVDQHELGTARGRLQAPWPGEPSPTARRGGS